MVQVKAKIKILEELSQEELMERMEALWPLCDWLTPVSSPDYEGRLIWFEEFCRLQWQRLYKELCNKRTLYPTNRERKNG